MQRTLERQSFDEQMLDALLAMRRRLQEVALEEDEQWARVFVALSAVIRMQEQRVELTRLTVGLQRVGLTRHTRQLMADVLDLEPK